MKTMNRGTLLKLARAGKLVCVESYHFDDMTGGDRKKGQFQVRIKEHGEPWNSAKEGVYNLREDEFQGAPGRAWINPDNTVTLYVHSNSNYTFRILDGEPKATGIASAKRPENARMQAFLKSNGIDAVPKYLHDGSLRGCWRLYNKNVKWSDELAAKLNALGFRDFDGTPLGKTSGNGGDFCAFVRGHNELLTDSAPVPAPATVAAPAPVPVAVTVPAPVPAAAKAFVPLVMPKNDKEGLCNKVRMIQAAHAAGNVAEVGFQLDDLLDSLLSDRVVFQWSSEPAPDRGAMVAAFCAAHPECVD